MTHTIPALARKPVLPPLGLFSPDLPATEPDHCTLVLDSRGVVVNCCETTGLIFHSSVDNLLGRTIWYLIINMTPSYTSPSFNARYIAAMSSEPRWRRFQAINMTGQRFPVEVFISSLETDGRRLFPVIVRPFPDALTQSH